LRQPDFEGESDRQPLSGMREPVSPTLTILASFVTELIFQQGNADRQELSKCGKARRILLHGVLLNSWRARCAHVSGKRTT